jgi:hypothetical protein
MAVLQNEHIRLNVDENGRLVHLERLSGGHGNAIETPADGLFRIVMNAGDNWEDVAFPQDQKYVVSVESGTLHIAVEKLVTKDHVVNVRVDMRIRLQGDQILFDASIDNRDTVMVNDFFYPCIGRIKSLSGGKPDLLWPNCAGERLPDIGAYVGSMGDWDGEHVMSGTYPGLMSMQWMSLVDQEECLYFAGHDGLFHTSILRVAGSRDRNITLEMDKLCFVRPGETWESPPYVLWLYEGSWRKGAKEYTKWAETWRKPVRPADWIRKMNGYFLVINKQQYGDELWPYDTLPELYEHAMAHGCDTLGLFGWYHSGHDNQYPDLEVSETLGGERALKENIKKVQAEGGHVTLYYQGHLMDTGSKFYKEKGYLLEGRTRWNTPYLEEYSKFHNSEYLKKFSKKLFATVCPSCTQWHDLMASRADWIASFGADGMLYDQIGGMPPYPCFNDEHPHLNGRPSLSYTQGRLKLLGRLHDQAKSLGREFAFMTEHETDVYSQFLDALHGIATNPGPPAGRRRDGNSMLNLASSFPEMFRYCFPETILTLRNPNPFLDPRYVNFAFLYGFRYEMELRYLKDQDVIRQDMHGEWKEYAFVVGRLRKKYEDVLLTGVYREQEGIQSNNPQIFCALFEGETRLAIALWNDTNDVQQVDLSVAGRQILYWETVDGSGEGMLKLLKPGAVAILLLG